MYNEIKKLYSSYGVDTEAAMKKAGSIPISLHIWQADDVVGFEKAATALSGGIQTTGNYPGRARNPEEVMQDLEFTLSLIPGVKRLNLHASYAITDRDVDRDSLDAVDFRPWVDFAKKHNLGLDFNPTFFSHPKVVNNLTLSSPDDEVREFWIRHGIQCRRIASYFAKELGGKSLCNIWIPDGFKDDIPDRLSPRLRFKDSLDRILEEKLEGVIDSIESKVFGIGLEAFTVGSNEFIISYTGTNRNAVPLIDAGHFHPTENIADKLSALLPFFDYIPLHVTRPMRWDSDHVVRLTDEVQAITDQIINMKAEDKIIIGLDYFDASVNRCIAWASGARNTQKALLKSCLTPWNLLKREQEEFDFSSLLSDIESVKTLPWGIVWDEYCRRNSIPVEAEWLKDAKKYEDDVTSKRR